MLYKLLVSDDTQARIAAVNMLQALVSGTGERQLYQQQAVALYGDGAILLYLTTKVQQLCITSASGQARKELGHMLQLLASVAQGTLCKDFPHA